MKRIIIHSETELELWEAVEYYETKCVGSGLDLEQEISRTLVNIQEAPKKWPERRYGARCRLLPQFPYVIYYLELQDIIWVVAVAHT
ncbi:MAG: type II toxin-antitoxin system RelE/ParE family toxin, partial [Desulfotomaculum sp.]|nr:type II toxin-antitoxin system RelE/ParE family toxin [Desulfotomaculum sp.]